MLTCSPMCFTNSSKFAHVLNTMSIIKQDTVLAKFNRTRLKTKTSVALPCIPVLMPQLPGSGRNASGNAQSPGYAVHAVVVDAATPPAYAGNHAKVNGGNFATVKPPPPVVQAMTHPPSITRVRFGTFFIKPPPTEPKHMHICVRGVHSTIAGFRTS